MGMLKVFMLTYGRFFQQQKFNAFITTLAFVLVLSGCEKKIENIGPEQTLNQYVNMAFAVKQPTDRIKLKELLAGQASSSLSGMDDEHFMAQFLRPKRKLLKIVILENKKLSENEVSVTYETVFVDDLSSNQVRTTQKKIALLKKLESGWKIAEFRNVKELLEYQNEISFP